MECWRVAAGQRQTGGFLLLTGRFLGARVGGEAPKVGYTKTWLQILVCCLVEGGGWT